MFSGVLPATLGQLTTLQKVGVRNTKMSGTLPISMSKLQQLKFLDVAGASGSKTIQKVSGA
jgi:hypothetical protein